ncbi:NAD(P)-binding domain-containing protein [Nesterenkonia lutea]|uniref:Thioredoxin reductase n=1 Tax=Nesterenkonia lutea TaxID=272919 RepID=A0ABR9JHH1_9MICC|nr:NAD(P)-binding domain-containing protein [Nesterenkonia lutea]MBE1524937.1 thioredoxin reductase [Nesterenkonia lutea]
MTTETASTAELPVVVIGAGPIGLAAAAHLLVQGLEPLILEAEHQVGATIREWGHIKLFSPWRYNIDTAAAALLEPTGWESPRPTALPTGADLVRDYLEPLAALPGLAGRIRTDHRVLAISRGQRDKTHVKARAGRPFVLRVAHAGAVTELQARAVIDASGTWGTPNPLGAAGLPALGEEDPAVVQRLLGSLPDVLGAEAERLAGRHTLVVGAGHSAVNTLLNLAALKRRDRATSITWAIRGESAERVYGGGDADQLPARGALGQRLRRLVEEGEITLVTDAEIHALEGAVVSTGSSTGSSAGVQEKTDDDAVITSSLQVAFADGRRVRVDFLAAATGFRPQLEMLRELRLELDPAVESPRRLATLIDPEFHSCGTVEAHGADVLAHPEEGFFMAGMKSYGRAPTFLLATGYEQVRSIAAHLAGADAAVRNLHLPETGVCSGVSAPGPQDEQSCGVPAADQTQSCSAPERSETENGVAVPEPLGAGLGASTGVLHGRHG